MRELFRHRRGGRRVLCLRQSYLSVISLISNKSMPMDETKLGNGVIGILAESCNIWERRVPLGPSHCARLLHNGRGKTGVERIIVQPSTKRIYHDAQYEDVGCEISEDLSDCGLIVGIKQPKLETILPDRTYTFFSHTHKAQRENMPLLDKILEKRASLYDYELIVGDNGKRLIAFGKYAGIAGRIDFLHGLGKRFLHMGYSTPFLSLGASYMYPSLAAAKAAVVAVGEGIAVAGLPSGICPLVFVFTGCGNVSQGAQEIFKLLPHSFVDPSKLPELFKKEENSHKQSHSSKRNSLVHGCIVTCEDMVAPKDPSKKFDKVDYYAHPDHYYSVFHEQIAPYTSVIVNCMYWEKRFPRLLTTKQLQDLKREGCPLVGVSDITCDIGGSMEFINQTTTIDQLFFRYNPSNNLYHYDMDGDGIICQSVDILPTEFAKEASQHFGDILSQFVGTLASTPEISNLPPHLIRACIAFGGSLTSFYEYITRMRKSDSENLPSKHENGHANKGRYTTLVSLSGHLFDRFLINEALDIIEAAGGSFHLVRCEVGQSMDTMSFSELEVGADDSTVLNRIIDSLSSIANSSASFSISEMNKRSLMVNKVTERNVDTSYVLKETLGVLILGAGRVCRPAAEFLSSGKHISSKVLATAGIEENMDIRVVVASLYLKDAEEIVEGLANATAVQLDATNYESLCKYVMQVGVVISLLPASFHAAIAAACIEHKKHLVTASYVDDSMSKLSEEATEADVTFLCEMSLDPGIDHMMAMKIINQAHMRKGKIRSFTSYCGGLPSPATANNPFAYKFSWSPAAAVRAGRNSATYKYKGETLHVDGNELFDSAVRYRVPDLPAFAFECLPNHNSLVYGDLYGIGSEASTIFRATLRYEGFSAIMGTLAKIGLFDASAHPMLKEGERPAFGTFLKELLKRSTQDDSDIFSTEEDMVKCLVKFGHCKEKETALKTVKAIKFLGLHEDTEIPKSCQSAFDVTCLRMEERLSYSQTEQDMVLLHHEIEVDLPDGQSERHQATLLEFGRASNGQMTTAMALTVGIPAAIGALLLLENKVKTRGLLRPLEPEIYMPSLEILEAYGFKLIEAVECEDPWTEQQSKGV